MAFDYTRLLGRVVNAPLLVTPEKARLLLGVLAPRAGLAGTLQSENEKPVKLADLASGSVAARGPRREGDRKYYPVVNGVAVIQIEGSLVHKSGMLDPFSGMTGYDGISTKLAEAVRDPDVRGILLDIDSPGGEVPGVFDLADRIAAARQTKPVWAIATEYAYSAAYALASQADRVLVPRTGGLGSIGVVYMHADFSKALETEGIKVTLVHAGAHKVDGNPFEPLPAEVRADIQTELDSIRNLFAATVARGRGLETSAVLATEAACFTAEEAVRLGLADAVRSPSEAFQDFVTALAAGLGGRIPAAGAASQTSKEKTMSEQPKTAPAAEPAKEAEKQPAAPQPAAAAPAEIAKQAEAAAKQRIAGILGCEEAKGREHLAQHLAFSTDMSVDAAKAALAAAPKAQAGLADKMAHVPNAEIGSDAPGEGKGGDDAGQALLATAKKHGHAA